MKRWSIALAVLLGMAGAGAGATAASAATTTCLVVDTNSNHSYTSLEAAVTAAAQGDTVFVKGTCTGTTEIGKNLTVSGQSASGTKTAALNGGGAGRVLTVDTGYSVTLNALIITGGGSGAPIDGADIENLGTLTLNGTIITGNSTGCSNGSGVGGGINNGGTVILNNNSSVVANTACFGGGIYSTGTVTLNTGSAVTRNITVQPPPSGGGIFNACGTVTVNDSSTITLNFPDQIVTVC